MDARASTDATWWTNGPSSLERTPQEGRSRGAEESKSRQIQLRKDQNLGRVEQAIYAQIEMLTSFPTSMIIVTLAALPIFMARVLACM